MYRTYKRRGFTLLEILVVISIIGIISTVAYVGYNDSRNNAADQALMAEFRQVQLALELYKSQSDNKLYPEANTTGSCGSSGFTESVSFDSTCVDPYIVGLAPGFIPSLPDSNRSANPACEIIYTVSTPRTSYKLTARECVAGGADITVDNELAWCPSSCIFCSIQDMSTFSLTSDFTKSFAVYGGTDSKCY